MGNTASRALRVGCVRQDRNSSRRGVACGASLLDTPVLRAELARLSADSHLARTSAEAEHWARTGIESGS